MTQRTLAVNALDRQGIARGVFEWCRAIIEAIYNGDETGWY